MALKRNGYKKNNGSKLKRNGNGVPDHVEQSLVYKGRERNLTKAELKELQREDTRTIKWLYELNNSPSFSREWILSCLHELTLQCMGKLPHVLGKKHVYDFMPKTAVSGLKVMAEIQGFNVWKLAKDGVITPAIPWGEDPNSKVIEHEGEIKQLEDLRTNDEITAEVLDIVTKHGALQSQAKGVIEAEVVEVHTT